MLYLKAKMVFSVTEMLSKILLFDFKWQVFLMFTSNHHNHLAFHALRLKMVY